MLFCSRAENRLPQAQTHVAGRSDFGQLGRAADRLPTKRWAVIWLLVALLTAGLVGGAELYWRSHGYRPSVTESGELWAYHRGRVYGDDTVVLLGQSRMHLDFSTEAFRRRFPGRRVVQLAVDGHPPMAALRDLANDERFTGLIICAFNSQNLRGHYRELQQPLVDAYHALTPVSRLTMIIDHAGIALLQSMLVVVHPKINLKNTLLRLLRSEPPEPRWFEVMNFDRSVSADFSIVDLEMYRRRCTEEWPDPLPPLGSERRPLPDTWLREALVVEPMIARLRSRGARIMIVHFPVTDELLELHEKWFPRKKYWDRFAAQLSSPKPAQTSVPVIHFQDVPTLAHFECPDMSHLDQRDTPRFTNALLDEVVRLGLIEPGSRFRRAD